MAAPVTLPRRSKGPKPQFFRDPALDHLLAMVIALTGELSVAIERHDTLERLLEKNGVVLRKAIEAYRPDDAVEMERFKVRDELIGRVFHILHEQAEVAQTMGKSARADKLSYIADDRGAILGGTEDVAKKKPAKKPARKAAKPKRAATRPKRAVRKPIAKAKKKARR